MNSLCPICDAAMENLWDNVFFCKKDNLYSCTEHKPEDYNADYLLHYKLYSRTELGERLNSQRWDFVLKQGLSGPLLDFGCGSDSFAEAKPRRVDTFSYDPYFKCNFEFFSANLDTVTFWDSFEHITRLGIVPLLNSRQLILSIPILREGVDLFSWKHFRPGEHIWYFSESALLSLFERWNYGLKDVSTFETSLGRVDINSYCFILREVT